MHHHNRNGYGEMDFRAEGGLRNLFRSFVCAMLALLVGVHVYAYIWSPQDSFDNAFGEVKYVVMQLTRGLSEVNRKHERLQSEMERISAALPAVAAAAGRVKDAVEPATHHNRHAIAVIDYDRQLADYALETGGARVVDTGDTMDFVILESLVSQALHALSSWLCRRSVAARAMINAGTLPGQCWAFRGSRGEATILLSAAVRVTGVSIEHIPAHISPTREISSAPRLFKVEGLELVSDTYPHDYGSFEYDKHGKPIQYFEVLHPSAEVYNYVKLIVISNWGNTKHTCVYRFRVHGELVSWSGAKTNVADEDLQIENKTLKSRY